MKEHKRRGNNPQSTKDAMLSIESQRVRGVRGKTKDKSTNTSKTKNHREPQKTQQDRVWPKEKKKRHQLETDTSASALEGKKSQRGKKIGGMGIEWIIKKHKTDPRYFTNHK